MGRGPGCRTIYLMNIKLCDEPAIITIVQYRMKKQATKICKEGSIGGVSNWPGKRIYAEVVLGQ